MISERHCPDKKTSHGLQENICKDFLVKESSTIYKELLKTNNKRPNKPIEEWDKDTDGYLSEENTQMTNERVRRCFTSHQGKRVKTTMPHAPENDRDSEH